MKQHITIEQLNELTLDTRHKLRMWAGNHDDQEYGIHYDYEMLSIGQMIEFLEEHNSDKSDFEIRIHSAGSGWQFPGQRLVDIFYCNHEICEDEVELCDALWEAVKEVLESANT